VQVKSHRLSIPLIIWVAAISMIAAIASSAHAQVQTIRIVGFTPNQYAGIIEQFEAQNPDIKVEVEVLPGSWGAQAEQIIVRKVAGVPFDVIRTATENFRSLVAADVFTPLTSYIQRSQGMSGAIDDIHPNLFLPFQYQEDLFMLPILWNAPAMGYNVNHFDQAGLAAPAEDWTWEDFRDLASKLTKRSSDTAAAPEIYGTALSIDYFPMLPWVKSGGARLLDDSWSESRANSPQMAGVFEFLQRLLWENESAVIRGGPYNPDLGTVSMWSQWGVANRPVEWSAQLWPRGESHTSVLGVGGIGLSKTSQAPDAAWRFMEFIFTPESQRMLHQSTGAVVARNSVMNEMLRGEMADTYQVLYNVLNDVRVIPSPPSYPELERVWASILRRVVNNDISPVNAAIELDHEIQTILINSL